MYSFSSVMAGITNYIDTEFVNKIEGWQKWVIGVGSALMLNNATNIFNEVKSNNMIKALGLINNEDEIDIDTLYKEFKKQAQKGSITVNIPMLGAVTFNESDVDKIYTNIKAQNE